MVGEYIYKPAAVRIKTHEGQSILVLTLRQGYFPADYVLCTLPIPLISCLVPDLPAASRERYEAIRNIGICCVILKLKRSLSPHFWVNMSGLQL